MNWELAVSAVITLFTAITAFRFAIPLAHRWRLFDIPSVRRRHHKPTPIVGGVTVFFSWAIGLAVYSALRPEWLFQHGTSLLSIGTSVGILIALGLFDDMKGATPKGKLFWQLVAAVNVLVFEPSVHRFCLQWQEQISYAAWPIAVIWLVGLSNATNLVDGLDGLAGGISTLVAGSLAVLCYSWGQDFGLALVTLLIPSVFAFLRKNWNPAQIFLGDNGSLSLGFLIGTISLMGPADNRSWVQIVGIILMMGYPIMDMGLCTFRRFKTGNGLFKADRNHLHHRMLRLHLTVRDTATLLLSITLYLQLTALSFLGFHNPTIGVLYMVATGIGLFSLIFLLSATEKRRAQQLVRRGARKASLAERGAEKGGDARECVLAKIDLIPLFEAGLFEEKERIYEITQSLKLMLQTFIRKEDEIYLHDNKLHIAFMSRKYEKQTIEALRLALRERLSLFQRLYHLQYSLADLPVAFESQHRRRPAAPHAPQFDQVSGRAA